MQLIPRSSSEAGLGTAGPGEGRSGGQGVDAAFARLCRAQGERFASPGWGPGCRELLSAIPALAWLPLTLLLSYKYAFAAGSSILAPTHSRTPAESEKIGCSEKKPSPASQELLFPRSFSSSSAEQPRESSRGVPSSVPTPSQRRGER